MPQDTPSRKLDQYIVRFPDGMRDKLKDAAKDNKRSMNAEIVERLERSFESEKIISFLQDHLAAANRKISRYEDQQPQPSEAKEDADAFLYVILDANGLPISLDEILEHTRAIRTAGKFDIRRQSIYVVDGKMESSSNREAEAIKLAEQYRKRLRKLER